VALVYQAAIFPTRAIYAACQLRFQMFGGEARAAGRSYVPATRAYSVSGKGPAIAVKSVFPLRAKNRE
jgi:hypothetical protein